MEWINWVLQPTLNIFILHYPWAAGISMLLWSVIAGLTAPDEDLLPTGLAVFMFGLFTPIVLALAIVLLPVLLTVMIFIAAVTLLIYLVKVAKNKTVGEK
jgi:small basic protein